MLPVSWVLGEMLMPRRKAGPLQKAWFGRRSISLAVKHPGAPRQFYEKFGFRPFAGGASKKF